MKSNRGITIISLLMYVIILLTVIGAISSLIKYFYKNADETIISTNTTNQHSKFITYLADDINSRKH